jgi:hypothetical protein
VAKSKPSRKTTQATTAKTKSTGSKAAKTMTKPSKRKAKAKSSKKARSKVVLLSGGNPQIAKAEGDAPVKAYIAALSGWQRDAAKRLDALVVRILPGVKKAVKWNSPFYGVEGNGWFMGVHVFAKYLKVAFFYGAALRPVPPVESKDKNTRYAHIHEGDTLDEAQWQTWLSQAAAMPGWHPGKPA